MFLTKVPDDLQVNCEFHPGLCLCMRRKMCALTATSGCHLRANPQKRHFARNRELEFTGKSQKNSILPVIPPWSPDWAGDLQHCI